MDDELQEKASRLGAFEPLEPPIFERMVTQVYQLVGQEQLWIARVLAIEIWVPGVFPLFLLARCMTSSRGAVVSLAYYLFLPFTVIVSRSFLPDVLMTVMTLTSFNFIYRWAESPSIFFALLAGGSATDFEMQVLAGGNYDPSDPTMIRGFNNRTEGYDCFLVTLFG